MPVPKMATPNGQKGMQLAIIAHQYQIADGCHQAKARALCHHAKQQAQ
jgi:hypothetical protein